jgi:hypothetical protein
MGYKNSPPYVQRQIDIILRPFPFAKAFVDDVTIFSDTLTDHLYHLQQVFGAFVRLNISIKPTKAFLGYPSIPLLSQRVDSFSLSTTDKKLAAIGKLQFPKTLKELEAYLGLTGYLRNYISHYAALAVPL